MTNFSFQSYVEQRDQKTLIIMRGISGAGKSTVAKKLHAEIGGVIYSTDDFFINPKTGKYEFDASKLSQNHEANKERTAEAMQQGISPIIIDNTNTKEWEMLPYVDLADQYGYEIEIKQPGSPDFPDVDLDTILQRQKSRGDKAVPDEIVANMYSRFKPNVTVQSIRGSRRK